MSHPYMVRIVAAGKTLALLSPHAVVAVMKHGPECEVVFASNSRARIGASAELVARLLWSRLNETDNSYYNDAHVVGVINDKKGSRLVVGGFLELSSSLRVTDWEHAIHMVETIRSL